MALRIKFVPLLTAIVLSFSALVAFGNDPQLTVRSRFNSAGSALTPQGKVRLELREVRTDAILSDGPAILSVLVLFEPKSGAFSWRLDLADVTASWRTLQFTDGQVAFLKDGEIIHFMAMDGPPRLFVLAFRGHASSMDDAEVQALRAAHEATKHRGWLDPGPNTRVISLLNLDRDFTIPPMSVASSIAPKVIDVQWDGSHWTVILKARWTEAITLDANYNLVSMRKVE